MEIKNFIIDLQKVIDSCVEDISDFEIKIDLDHCLDPNEIQYAVDFYNKEVIITKGNCGL